MEHMFEFDLLWRWLDRNGRRSGKAIIQRVFALRSLMTRNIITFMSFIVLLDTLIFETAIVLFLRIHDFDEKDETIERCSFSWAKGPSSC